MFNLMTEELPTPKVSSENIHDNGQHAHNNTFYEDSQVETNLK